jgi:hypothetical protein
MRKNNDTYRLNVLNAKPNDFFKDFNTARC